MTESSERDDRALSAVRDTLELAVAEYTPHGGRADRIRRTAEALASEAGLRLAQYCNDCCGTCPDVRFGGERWTVRCPLCGRSAGASTLAGAEEAWNDLVGLAEGEE